MVAADVPPGDDVVDASPGYLAVAGDGGEGEGGEPGDHVAEGDHQQTLAIITSITLQTPYLYLYIPSICQLGPPPRSASGRASCPRC